MSLEQAAQVQAELMPNLKTDAVGATINAAAQQLTSQRFDDCIAAYHAIAAQHPEEQGTCLGQIGACYFFKGEFSTAIQHYTAAKKSGADPEMMDDNIQEAQEELAKLSRAAPADSSSDASSVNVRAIALVAVGIFALIGVILGRLARG
jgi:DNA-binding SARP family transcriptional activator